MSHCRRRSGQETRTEFELNWQAAPLRTVLAAPNDRLDGPAQIMALRLVVRTAGLDQRF